MKFKNRLLIPGIGVVFLLIIAGISGAVTRRPKVQLEHIVMKQFRTDDSIHIVIGVTNSGYSPIGGAAYSARLECFAKAKTVESPGACPSLMILIDPSKRIKVHDVLRLEFAVPTDVIRFKCRSVAYVPSFQSRTRKVLVDFLDAHPSWFFDAITSTRFNEYLGRTDSHNVFYSPEFLVDAPPLEPSLDP
jgi:hypothetical protein